MRKEEVEKIGNLSSENWERRKFSIKKLEQKEGTKARSRPWKDVKSWREFERQTLLAFISPSRYFSNRTKRLMNFTLFLVDDDLDGKWAKGSNIEIA